jgi:Domain of unknown function (DUF4157)
MSTLPTLEIASLSRLRRFVSGRQAAPVGLSRRPALRLSVAGALPGFQRHAVVRRPVESVVSPEPATAFASSNTPSTPPTRAGQALAETRPAHLPPVGFFRSLLTGAPASTAATAPPKQPSSQPRSQPPPAPRWQRLVERAALDPAQRLPAGLRDFLGGRLKRWLPGVQIHQGLAADELTSALRADAVTFADRIVVRHRRYQPHRPEGVALLGHELFHVAEAATPQRRLPVAAEEHAALSHEHRLLHEVSTPKSTPPVRSVAESTVPAVASRPVAPSVSMTSPVRAAMEERPLPVPSQPTADVMSERQLTQLKDQVYRDLLRRLRTEFERGS